MHASCLLAGLYRLTLRMDRITLNEAAAAAAMGGWCCAMAELDNAMDRGLDMSNLDEALVGCGCGCGCCCRCCPQEPPIRFLLGMLNEMKFLLVPN